MMKRILAPLVGVLWAGIAVAAQAPDTPVVTGPNNAQVPIGNTLVTPTGGTQQRLGDALANPVGTIATNISAAGTNQGNATPIIAHITIVTSVAANSGVILPPCALGLDNIIVNQGVNALTVYPFSQASIFFAGQNYGSSNPVSISAFGKAEFLCAPAGLWTAF